MKFLSVPRSASRSLNDAGLSLEYDGYPHPSLDNLPPIEEVNVVLKDPVKWYISFWAKSRTQGALLDWGLEYDDIEADLYKLLSFDKPRPETIIVRQSCSGCLEKDSQAVYANEYVKTVSASTPSASIRCARMGNFQRS